jgi:hypothetical protein
MRLACVQRAVSKWSVKAFVFINHGMLTSTGKENILQISASLCCVQRALLLEVAKDYSHNDFCHKGSIAKLLIMRMRSFTEFAKEYSHIDIHEALWVSPVLCDCRGE